ncbi:hypothetical protein ACR15_002185 [Escherichia coli]|nr:hypothetical protein [Escherichia coli]
MWLIDLILACWLIVLVGFVGHFAWEEGNTMDAEMMFMACCWGIVAVGLFLRWVIEKYL